MPYVNIPESTLAPLLALQIGRLESSFSSKISNSLNRIEEKFEKGCPTEREIKAINSQLDAIKDLSVSITDRLNKIQALTGPLRKSSKAIAIGATVLKALPIPGLSLTAGATTTFSDTLHTIKEYSTQLNTTADSIDTIISQTNRLKDLLQQSANFIERVETALEFCKICNDSGNNCSKDCISTIVKGSEKDARECIDKLNENLNISVASLDDSVEVIRESEEELYKNYTIKIVEVPSDYTKATLRQAIAVNRNGIIEFRGNKSFSSSTEVLKKEVKLSIDSKLFLEDRKESNSQPSSFFTSNQFGSNSSFDELSITQQLASLTQAPSVEQSDEETQETLGGVITAGGSVIVQDGGGGISSTVFNNTINTINVRIDGLEDRIEVLENQIIEAGNVYGVGSEGEIAFWENNNNTLSGSSNLTYSGSVFSVKGSVEIDDTVLLSKTLENINTTTSIVAEIPTSSYSAVFFDFLVSNGSNLKAGTIYTVHSGGVVEYTEISTNDIGDTSDIELKVEESSGNIVLKASTTSNSWNVKTLVRGI